MILSTIERVLLLKGMDLFSRLASQDLLAIANVALEVHLDAGEIFIKKGEPGDCLYLLVDGEASVVVPEVGQVAVRRAPTSIGEMALITHQPRTADCVALTDITALRIDRYDFSNLLVDQPSVAVGIMTLLAQRLSEALETIRQQHAART